jgi:hypothetical protein
MALNIVNLLAAQWGDFFTNVGDLAQGPLSSRDGETVVWTGTESRQHILGHLGLLGVPVSPMSAGGPRESYIGDPLWESLATGKRLYALGPGGRPYLKFPSKFQITAGRLLTRDWLGKEPCQRDEQFKPAYWQTVERTIPTLRKPL